MRTMFRSSAAHLVFGAGLILGSLSLSAAVQPAFSQEGGHTGSSGSSGTESHQSGGHESGGCGSSGGCSGESHESGGHESGGKKSGGHESGGHSGGQKGGSGKGHSGATVDRSHGGGKSSGVKGHVFDQPEANTDEESNKGPHPGGNPKEKDGESHESGEHEATPQ